jgi:hypothetical protein
MAIKRYYAEKDNTITNAYDLALSSRATGSNMGAADILEVFSIYGQYNTSSAELSRVLVQFPISSVSADRTAGTIPVSGSVKFYLRLYNARHSEQVPENFTVNVLAVSQSWQEGYGLDMESYTDVTDDSIEGSNWMNRNSNPLAKWTRIGGEYHSSSYVAGERMPNYTYTFTEGTEDMFLDVTSVVEEWMAGTQTNNGFGVFLTASYEAHTTASNTVVLHNSLGVQRSYYTKRFFSRTSEFFFKRPLLEARWDSRIKDDRNNFYFSSSMAPGEDNLNTIFLYNYVRGQLRNIPGVETGKILVSLYSGSTDDSAPAYSKLALSQGAPGPNKGGGVVSDGDFNITGAYVSTGIYSASLAFTGSDDLKTIYDVWYSSSVDGAPFNGTKQYFTGTIKPETLASPGWNQYTQYTTKITNLKSSYSKEEQARFRVFARPRDFSPTIYNVASTDIENTIIPSSSYEIIRVADNETIINNSTASSDFHTYMSYDDKGNYFDFDMSMLEPGYLYAIKLSYFTSNGWREQQELFKFRVENN